MTKDLSTMKEISQFGSERQYDDLLRSLNELFQSGAATDLGEVDAASTFYVRRIIFHEQQEVWLLAAPDQAFRGFFRREGVSRPPQRLKPPQRR